MFVDIAVQSRREASERPGGRLRAFSLPSHPDLGFPATRDEESSMPEPAMTRLAPELLMSIPFVNVLSQRGVPVRQLRTRQTSNGRSGP